MLSLIKALTIRSDDDLSEGVWFDRPQKRSMSERAVQTLIAITEPFPKMFKHLVEQRGTTDVLLPDMDARGAFEFSGEADSSETSELFPRDLGVASGKPNDVISSHSEFFTLDTRPETGEWFVADEKRRSW